MPRYVAFLRAINVGGRVVKMNDLRRLFSSFGYENVETFIASGNVIFDSPSRNTARLEESIQEALERKLGYRVVTFIRSVADLAALAAHPLVAAARDDGTVYVAFLQRELSKDAARQVGSMKSDVEEFVVTGRELLWILRGRFSDSKFSGPLLEKTLAVPTTVRNSTTVRRLAAKYSLPRRPS